MKIFLANNFKRAVKKLQRNQITALEEAIQTLKNNPMLGNRKTGDLLDIRVYKFHIHHQLILLAYTYNEQEDEIILLYFAPYENFYSALKNQIKC